MTWRLAEEALRGHETVRKPARHHRKRPRGPEDLDDGSGRRLPARREERGARIKVDRLRAVSTSWISTETRQRRRASSHHDTYRAEPGAGQERTLTAYGTTLKARCRSAKHSGSSLRVRRRDEEAPGRRRGNRRIVEALAAGRLQHARSCVARPDAGRVIQRKHGAKYLSIL